MKTTDSEKTLSEIRSALERGEAIEVLPLPDEPPGVEISLVELGKAVLAGWKRILICTIIFALIGLMLGGLRLMQPEEAKVPAVDKLELAIPADSERYQKVFEEAAKMQNQVSIYLNALQLEIRSNRSIADKTTAKDLLDIKEQADALYEDKFIFAQDIWNLYQPEKGSYTDQKIIQLNERQKTIQETISGLESELAYLERIVATAGTKLEGPTTDAAIAAGVGKAAKLASLQLEYQENTTRLLELTGANMDPEKTAQTERMDALLAEGFAEYERLALEINYYASEYAKQSLKNITAGEFPTGEGEQLVYSVTFENLPAEMTSSRFAEAIFSLMAFAGFGLGCLWVSWRYYKQISTRQ